MKALAALTDLNCLTDTRHGVNFSWQPAFSFDKVIKLCVWALQRWIHTGTSELELDLRPLKYNPKGLQVHRCTQLFECFWDSRSIYIYYEYKHMLPKLCMNKCKIYRRLAENFQALDGRRKTILPPPWLQELLQQWLHCQTSTYTILMENSISLLCSFQS